MIFVLRTSDISSLVLLGCEILCKALIAHPNPSRTREGKRKCWSYYVFEFSKKYQCAQIKLSSAADGASHPPGTVFISLSYFCTNIFNHNWNLPRANFFLNASLGRSISHRLCRYIACNISRSRSEHIARPRQRVQVRRLFHKIRQNFILSPSVGKTRNFFWAICKQLAVFYIIIVV